MHDLYGGVYDGRLGSLGVMNNKEVVLEVKFLGNDDKHKDIFYTLKHNVLTKKVFDSLDNYFLGKQRYFDLPLMPKGGDFAQKVWRELQRIPYGQTRSYKQIAQNINSPRGSRAVGMANHRNPIIIFIPCHRVIGSKGISATKISD